MKNLYEKPDVQVIKFVSEQIMVSAVSADLALFDDLNLEAIRD